MLLAQLANQERVRTEARGTCCQGLLHGIEGTEKMLALHDDKATRVGTCPVGLVCRVEFPLNFEESCHGFNYAWRQTRKTSSSLAILQLTYLRVALEPHRASVSHWIQGQTMNGSLKDLMIGAETG